MLQKTVMFIKMIFFLIIYQKINLLIVKCDQPITYSKMISIKNKNLAKIYFLSEEIGKGEQGTVYLAYDLYERKFAIKKQSIKNFQNQKSSNDAIFGEMLVHENIIKYFGSEIIDDYEYTAFEYHPHTLSSYLKENPYSKNDILFIMKQILDVTSYLSSEKILYNDFTSENVMVTDNLKIILIDFGRSMIYKPQEKIVGVNLRKNRQIQSDPNPSDISKLEIINIKSNIYEAGRLFKQLFSAFYLCEYFFTEIQKNFFRHCFEKNPNARFSAFIALLHPIFDPLYDFVFCFKNLNGYEYLEGDIKLTILENKLSYCNNDIAFEIYCCCSGLNSEKFTHFTLSSNPEKPHSKFCSSCSSYFKISKYAKFKVIINQKTLPLQHLTYKYYSELKNAFKIIKIHCISPQTKPRIDFRKIILASPPFILIGSVIIFLKIFI